MSNAVMSSFVGASFLGMWIGGLLNHPILGAFIGGILVILLGIRVTHLKKNIK